MFKITSNKGFHITFDNGYTVSVQFGGGNYCANYDDGYDNPVPPSPDAECAVWPANGEMLDISDNQDGNTVKGWMTPKEVLDLLIWAEAQ